MSKRLLLTGGSGMFGSDAAGILERAGFEVVPVDLPELDITDGASVGKCFDKASPDIVVNAAAFTDVDGAESNREEAFRVNGSGAGLVAEECSKRGVFMVQISTDYVFPGTRSEGYSASDPAGPAESAYGASKLEGERRVAGALPERGFLICRTQWLYGRNGKNFVTTIARMSRERERIEIVDDQWGTPTWTKDLANQVAWLLKNGATGFAHTVGGGGPLTWCAFGREIVNMTGGGCEVVPISSEKLARPAKRPKHGWLRNATIPDTEIMHYRESLSEFLREAGLR